MRSPRLLLCAALATALFSFTKEHGKAPLPSSARQKFAEVPAGDAFINGERVPVRSFFMARTEVSNAEYRAFLNEVRRNNGADMTKGLVPGGDAHDPEQAIAQVYYTDRAFDTHPVVNISAEAARAYCAWLEEKLNAEARPGLSYRVRLPDRASWVLAAQGGLGDSPYAWGGPNVRNAQGCILCNLKASTLKNQKVVYSDGDDGATLTAPVDSYTPNGYGLFNMNGNVAEWLAEPGLAAGGSWSSTAEEVRNESVMQANGPSALVGFRPLIEVTGK